MSKQDLGNGWYAVVGQEYPVEAWAFSVFHEDDNDANYNPGWWSDRARLGGFLSLEQATKALELFLQHEALKHCEAHARGRDEKLDAVEVVQVFYRFATRHWSYRLSYVPTGVSGWAGYLCGEYSSAASAIKAGQEHWEKLRKLGTGGTGVDPTYGENKGSSG